MFMEIGVFRGGRDMLKCDENGLEVTTEFALDPVQFPRTRSS